MARTVLKLEEEENRVFHMNYAYMWKKLNTAPYYVSGAGEMPKWIREQWLLPSYANLSKCLNPEFVPSVNLVNKIVQFYNANIQPAVDSYTFLHEKLENSDHTRSASSFSDPAPFCGIYHCYYYAGLTNRTAVYGALLSLRQSGDVISAQMVAGITDELGMYNPALTELFAGGEITPEKYAAFRSGLELSRRRTALFRGRAELQPGLLTLQMISEDHGACEKKSVNDPSAGLL